MSGPNENVGSTDGPLKVKAESDRRNEASNGGKAASRSSSRQLIYALNENDVLLGRGQHVKNLGNTRFRTLVRSRVVDYGTCRSKTGKDTIAREIMQSVLNQGGRFVRRADVDIADSVAAHDPEGGGAMVDELGESTVWELADEATVLVKVKQTFRDYTVIAKKAAANRRTPSASAAAIPVSHQSSSTSTETTASLQGSFFPAAASAGGSSSLLAQQLQQQSSSSDILTRLALLQSSRFPSQISNQVQNGLAGGLQGFASSNAASQRTSMLLNDLQLLEQRQRQQELLTMLSQQRAPQAPMSSPTANGNQIMGGRGGDSSGGGLSFTNGSATGALGNFPMPSMSTSSRLSQEELLLLNQIAQQRQQQQSALLPSPGQASLGNNVDISSALSHIPTSTLERLLQERRRQQQEDQERQQQEPSHPNDAPDPTVATTGRPDPPEGNALGSTSPEPPSREDY